MVGDLVGNADLIIEQIAQAEVDWCADRRVFPSSRFGLSARGSGAARGLSRGSVARSSSASPSHATDIVALVGYPQAHPHGVANALAVLADGEVKASYRKQLLPNYGVFDERRYFVPGDEPLRDQRSAASRSDCRSARTSGSTTRSTAELARLGARLILNASASPFHIGKSREREEMLSERANRSSSRSPTATSSAARTSWSTTARAS